ncbi:MAG TPA: M90 family metallopeptidase [Burkholderiaceae bacterium]|nr:M90 family metallopeptidase [Burkholderiaceae bacterium]
MLNRLRQYWQRQREERALERRAIPDALWALTLERYPFLANRSEDDRSELRRLASLFLDEKEFTGIDGFVVTDDIAVAVAAQACLPVLRLGLESYHSFVGIVMHADEVVAQRTHVDEAGVVHHYDEVLTGEAMEGGPVMLTWNDVRDAGELASWAYNVVIHEFAHVLDMTDGVSDGVPLLPTQAARAQWLEVLLPEYDRFAERVVCGHETVLDPYGAESPDEFFAVASEAFFVAPLGMKKEQPALYRLLSSYYRQDPAAAW